MKKIRKSVACEKAIRMSVYVAAVYLEEKRMNKEKSIIFLQERMKEIAKKYGYRFSMSILKNVLDTKENRKSIRVTIDKKEKQVELCYDVLQKMFNEYIEQDPLDIMEINYPI